MSKPDTLGIHESNTEAVQDFKKALLKKLHDIGQEDNAEGFS